MPSARVSAVRLVAAPPTPRARVSAVRLVAVPPIGHARVSAVRLRTTSAALPAARVSLVQLRTGLTFPARYWDHARGVWVPILEFRAWDPVTGTWEGVRPGVNPEPPDDPPPPPPPGPTLPVRLSSGLAARSRSRATTDVLALLKAGVKGSCFLEANWRDIQPTSEAIDPAWIAGIVADLDWSHSHGLVSPIRLFAGYQAPDWVATATGGGLDWYSGENGTGAQAPSNPSWRLLARKLAPYWHPAYQAAYESVVRGLAGLVEVSSHPAFAGLTMSLPCTQYAEPFINQFSLAENRATALAAGWTRQKQLDAFTEGYRIHRQHLSPLGHATYLAANNLQVIGPAGGYQDDVPNTLWLIDRFVSDLGAFGVVGNNSFQVPTTKYPAMYPRLWAHAAAGQALHLQTETGPKTEDLWDTQPLDGKVTSPQAQAEAAFSHGASSMEMFAGAEDDSVVDADAHAAHPSTAPLGATRWPGISVTEAERFNALGWNNGHAKGLDQRRTSAVPLPATMRKTRGVMSWGTSYGKVRADLEPVIQEPWCVGFSEFMRASHVLGPSGLTGPNWTSFDVVAQLCDEYDKDLAMSMSHGNAEIGWPTSWRAELQPDEIISHTAEDTFPAFHSVTATNRWRDFVSRARDRYAGHRKLCLVKVSMPVWGKHMEPWFQGGSAGRARHLAAWNSYVTRTGTGVTGDAAMLDAYYAAWRSQVDWYMREWPAPVRIYFSVGDGFNDVVGAQPHTSSARHPRQYAAINAAIATYGDRLVIGYDGATADGVGSSGYGTWVTSVYPDQPGYIQPYTGVYDGPEPLMTVAEQRSCMDHVKGWAHMYEGYRFDTRHANADAIFAGYEADQWADN